MHIRMYVYIYIYIYIYKQHVHVCVYIYIYIYTHTYTQTCIYTHLNLADGEDDRGAQGENRLEQLTIVRGILLYYY